MTKKAKWFMQSIILQCTFKKGELRLFVSLIFSIGNKSNINHDLGRITEAKNGQNFRLGMYKKQQQSGL